MQASNLDAVLGRALRDEKFRQTMMTDPVAVGKEYKLSDAEVTELKAIDQAAAKQFFTTVGNAQQRPPWSTDKTCYEKG